MYSTNSVQSNSREALVSVTVTATRAVHAFTLISATEAIGFDDVLYHL